jgi:streptogramin lyase
VDAQGNVYVADQYISAVIKWAPGATSGIQVAPGLEEPTDLFMDNQGSLYVSNQDGECVFKYAPDFSSYTVVAGAPNQGGNLPDLLSSPTGIYVDSAGNLYVADTENSRIMKWAPGATQGVVVAGGNGNGSQSNQLNYPLDVVTDCAGNLYVSDMGNNRVQFFQSGQTSGTTIAGDGAGGVSLNEPASVYLDGNGSVYISDAGDNRILQYSFTIDRSYIAKTGGIYTRPMPIPLPTTDRRRLRPTRRFVRAGRWNLNPAAATRAIYGRMDQPILFIPSQHPALIW